MKKLNEITLPLAVLLLLASLLNMAVEWGVYWNWTNGDLSIFWKELLVYTIEGLLVLVLVFLGRSRLALLVYLADEIWNLFRISVFQPQFFQQSSAFLSVLIVPILWIVVLRLLFVKSKWGLGTALLLSTLLLLRDLSTPYLTGISTFYTLISYSTQVILFLIVYEEEYCVPSKKNDLYQDKWFVNLLYTVLSLGIFSRVWMGHLLYNTRHITGRHLSVTGNLFGAIFLPYIFSIYVYVVIQTRLEHEELYNKTSYSFKLPFQLLGVILSALILGPFVTLPLLQVNADYAETFA